MNYIFAISYCLFVALSGLMVHVENGILSPALMLFFSTSFAIVVFHLLNLTRLRATYRTLYQAKRSWFGVMLVIVLIWCSTMYGYVMTSPAIFLLIYFITIFGLGLWSKTRLQQLRKSYSIAIGGCMVLASLEIITRSFNIPTLLTTRTNLMGMSLAVLGGIGTFMYSKQSYHLTQKTGLNATQILAVRFWLLWILALAIVPFSHSSLHISTHALMMLMCISVMTMVLPLICFQESIIRIGPEPTVIIIGIIPSIAYIITAVYTQSYKTPLLIAYLFIAFMIGLAEYLSAKRIVESNLVKKNLYR